MDDGRAEQVGELEVVEAGQRHAARRGGERVQRADGVAVVGGEDGGRPALVGHRQQAGDGGPGGGGVAVAGHHERRILLDAGVLQGRAVARDALARGVETGVVGDAGDAGVAVGEQVLDRAAGAAEVVEQHRVGGGAYRSQRITTLELRFNPMKRNRGGERDLDHIILAAIRGLDLASLEYPQVRAGLILMMDRTFEPPAERDHRGEGDPLGGTRAWSESTSPGRGPGAAATTTRRSLRWWTPHARPGWA